MEHSSLYDLGVRSELRNLDPSVPGSSMCDHDRRISGVYRGDNVDRRTVPGARATRIRAWLYAGVLQRRRVSGRGCLLPRGDLRGTASIDLVSAPALALHIVLRIGSCDSAGSDSAFPAGIPGVERQKAPRDVEPAAVC